MGQRRQVLCRRGGSIRPGSWLATQLLNPLVKYGGGAVIPIQLEDAKALPVLKAFLHLLSCEARLRHLRKSYDRNRGLRGPL